MTVINKIIRRVVTHGRGKKNGYELLCLSDTCNNKVYVKSGVFDEAHSLDRVRVFCCSRKCLSSDNVKLLLQDEFEKQHGVRNQFQLPEVKEKIKHTMVERYGVDNPSKSPEVWEKIRNTWREKYGTMHPLQNEEVKNKTKTTRDARYPDRIGYCNRIPTQETNLSKYGNIYYFASDIGKMTIDNFISRYGTEEGTRRWTRYTDLKKQTLDNFILRYGNTEGPVRYEKWKNACKQTRANFIKRYGKREGEDRYNKYYSQKLNKLLSGSRSSLQIEIANILADKSIPIIENYRLVDNDRNYYYDILVEGTDIIIEVNGDFWHANPTLYNENAVLNFPGGHRVAKDIWNKDKIKLDVAKARGYSVYTVWEAEYRDDADAVINNIIKFIGAIDD